MPENWGSFLGRVSSWLDPLFNKRKSLERRIADIERKIEFEKKLPASSVQSHILDGLTSNLSRLRSEKSRLKD